MSRTFRRRNKETVDQYRKFEVILDPDTGIWLGWFYKKLDGKELKAALCKFHSERHGKTYGWSAPKLHRKLEIATQRMCDKTELHKYKLDTQYEPMVFTKKPLPYWT